MNTRIDDALDVIEFTTQHERSTLCRKQEATLPGYTNKMAVKLTKLIEKAVSKADKRHETVVSTTHCSDRLFLCFGDRITDARIMSYAKGSTHLYVNWAVFIRDHKLTSVAAHQLGNHLNRHLPGYRVFSCGETFNHEYEFVLIRSSKERA